MDEKSSDLDSWSIPKRKPPQSQAESSSTSSSLMNMTIPKKKSHPSAMSSQTAAAASWNATEKIPKRPSSSFPATAARSQQQYQRSANNLPDMSTSRLPSKKRPASSLDDAIPRRKLPTSAAPSTSGFNPSFDSMAIPRRNSYGDGTSNPPEVTLSDAIPRKKHSGLSRKALPLASKRRVEIVSKFPFIVKCSLKGVPLHEGIPRFRSSKRDSKRVLQSYKDDSDSDDFLVDSDDDDDDVAKNNPKPSTWKKKSKLKKMSKVSSASSKSSSAPSLASTVPVDTTGVVSSSAVLALNSNSIEAPPPGTLSTLWYSREIFMNIHIVEKVIAWRSRTVTQLEWIPESLEGEAPTTIPTVDSADAAKWSNLALTNPMIWFDPSKRMEVSRLSPARCPIIMAMACEAQSSEGPKFRIKPLDETNQEEVYLVKWRGRSHLHASWERGSDIIKFDQSANTARHKLRRFVQAQELAFGKNWKKVLEDERATSAAIHNHGETPTEPGETEGVEEEYFPPANLEVERILACDESEMDMNLFATQRGFNVKNEQIRIKQKEAGIHKKWNSKEGLQELLRGIPWDPEDNVRYVVKWKGLPFAEMTWEYWRDIKRDAVDEAEDFWLRQKPPSPERVSQLLGTKHPHISQFRKLQESPVYGISNQERKIADVGQAKEEEEDIANPGFRLRSYQLEGVNWLLFNWWNRRSCILADEMGLGKTIQSMCFIRTLQMLPTTGVRGPYLIVAPLSLIGQWQSEARSWAPDLNVVLYHGSADARDFLVKQDFFYTDQFVPRPTAVKLKKQHVTKFHILITTYEVVLKDASVFSKIKWRALIVDEAHRLKNPKSRLFEDLGTVPRDFCLLLTGTPLANATEELWALLHFADKKAFADKDEFLEKFGQLTDATQVNELHSILKPYLLRRVKEDVEKSLLPKEETILEVSLTPIQKKFYKAIYERNTAFLYKGSKPSNAPSLMNVMMELRKCCNHPYLVRGAGERILADAASQTNPGKDEEGNDLPIDHYKIFGEQLIKSSGKMVLISKLLPKLFANGHKVLIFSQMVRVLDLLEELLRIMKYKYERLDGSTSSSSRAAAVDRFCRKSCQRFVMLLSTRAGGLGLNLTAADIVIIFDSDWNPQNDLQAMARAHRIGQTRAVRVYRLLTAKTYEMHMFHSASMKLGLERAVLSQQREQGEDNDAKKTKSKSDREAQAKEIDSLLKKGAYDVFKEEDDAEAQKFMETDIDQLLESNAQTVTYGKNENNLSSGLGSFSKASFVTDTGDGEKDVDLDDPDFWKKAAGLDAPIETPEDIAQMLDDGVKRSRKQVQVFDPFADFAELEQRKEDKKLQKIREEKEEKERARIERKMKKMIDKEKRKRDKEILRGSLFGKSKAPISHMKPDAKFKLKKKEQESILTTKEPKQKKPKKSAERRRALRRAANEDPAVERLKQAWDVSQRNRAVAACLRFGFQRFCKIRSEANLTSLPIQDMEVFFRSFFFQLSLQLGVSIMYLIQDTSNKLTDQSVRAFLGECLGDACSNELHWICDCVANGMKAFLEVESRRRFLRLPAVLAEHNFAMDLRRGGALRALRRMFVSNRLTRIVEGGLDDILSELGYEQLAKRGCQTSDFASLDADLKARLVNAEELSLSMSERIKPIDLRPPVAWWDRSCDIALLIGTFVHGLGNYEAMQCDESLPFSFKIKRFAVLDEACSAAQSNFYKVAKAAKGVFHEALEAAKIKDQLQIQAAVAAAAAASSEREKDALALRAGGEAAEAVPSAAHETPQDKLYEIDGDDRHFITLPRLKRVLSASLQPNVRDGLATEAMESDGPIGSVEAPVSDEKPRRRRGNSQLALAMPDARILDYRLNYLINAIEGHEHGTGDYAMKAKREWPSSQVVLHTNKVKRNSQALVSKTADILYFEQLGVGLHGIQCGSSHRSLDDGSDYFIGSASVGMSHIAYGTDAPRYLRAIGVPMNMTRFAVSALAYADGNSIDKLISSEQIRNLPEVPREVDDDTGGKEQTDGAVEADMHKSGLKEPLVDAAGKNEKDSAEDIARTVKEESNLNAVPKKPTQVPEIFAKDTTLRASICAIVLHYGFPSKESDRTIFKTLWKNIREQCVVFDDVPPSVVFSPKKFIGLVQKLAGKGVHVPSFDVIHDFILDCLLPHCLRLCLMGNGPSLENARGSKGKYETPLGISLYPTPTDNLQCELPDPCLELEEHSVEALAAAFAILRRAQLLKCATELATGRLSMEKLDGVLRSSFMRKSMNGLPVWWCPWIHDAALLVHATTNGLFSIFADRKSEDCPIAFSHAKILEHMKSTFVTDETALPQSVLGSLDEESEAWMEHHAAKFPSFNVVERRLAFLCGKASELLEASDCRYENLPMFDHGAWPRN